MTEVIKGEKLKNELWGRDPLTDSIRLYNDNEGGTAASDFLIEGVLHAGGSCICYRATRFYENGDMAETGTLKEFYPVDFNTAELSYNLKRHDIDDGEAANQLYSKGLTADNFKRARDEFYSSYKKISELKFDNSEYDNFFAPIVIYKGIAKKEEDADNYTIYVWTPGDNVTVSFDDYLKVMQEEICERLENPLGSPDLFLAEKLRTVIQSIKALAVGIEKLHLDNLLHLDIKPSNFGVRMLRKNDGDHISVSLYDVNTIYSRSNPLVRTGGTPGFRAPEIINDWENNYNMLDIGVNSDIYSLGATLYNSIVILSKGNRGIYDVGKFEQIDADISHSMLIEPSEFNSKADLHDILATMLKRSLARKSSDYFKVDNYVSVGEFIEDLQKADDIIRTPISLARENGLDKKIITQVVDKETYYDDKIDTGATGAIQCLLYDKPLYDYADKNGKVNVLVLGAGVYSQKFLDVAFEMSQVKNCYLDVTVITNEKEKDEARYLSVRPEFHNYFWVNGNKPELDDYGSIRFLNVKNTFETEKPGFSVSLDNALIAEDTLEDSGKTFSYVFISLVDQYLNKKVAEDLALSDIVNASDETQKAIINFVWYGKEDKNISSEFEAKHLKIVDEASASNVMLSPTAIKNTLVCHKNYSFIKRMAFNCHLIWCDNLSDIKKTYGQFRSIYNFSSSLSMALSCKYKLWSMGLSLDNVTDEKDSDKREELLRKLTLDYRDKIGLGLSYSKKTEEQKNNLKNLTMYEHRRWNVNAICSSYRSLKEDEYETLKTDNKDKKNRKHPCLVPCNDSWTLTTKDWKEFSKWDESDVENTENFKKLDPLDRMSVKLHKHFKKLDNNFTFEKLENDASLIRRYLYNNPEALAAFNAYMISLKAVRNRKSRKETPHKQYEHCRSVLNKILRDNPVQNSEEIKKRLENIETVFAPVRLAYDYTDYKEKDQRLINGIPFILNYSTSMRICTPLIETSNDNNNWFENVASSIVINPSVLTYLVNIKDCNEVVSSIKDTLFNVTRIMDNHDLQTKISLIIYTKSNNGTIFDNIKEEIKKELSEISDRIYNVEIVEARNQKELASRIRNTLETNLKTSSRFTAIELKDNFISGTINAIGNPSIKTYEFNSAEKSFTTEDNEGYIWFSDIVSLFKPHLNIEDMFIAHGRLSVYEEPELHRDYKKIWDNCYSDPNLWERANKSMAWKQLCALFKSRIEETDILASIDIRRNSEQNNWADEEVSIFAPAFCKASFERIFNYLKLPKVNLISQDSSISEYNSATVKLVFKSSQDTRNAVLKILQNPYLLADSSKIKLIPAGNGRHVQIVFDSLMVSGLSWIFIKDFFKSKGKEYLFNTVKKTFEYLVKEGYIIISGQPKDDDVFSICFPSSQIKSLLTNEGQLLEIYIYYKTLEEGHFDELKTGLEVHKLKEDKSGYIPTQEFDMIAIKGFQTQFIEIKARGNVEQGFYQKLEANGNKFGINKKLTLVSDFGDYSKPHVIESNTEAIVKGKEDYNVETIYGIKEINSIGKALAKK